MCTALWTLKALPKRWRVLTSQDCVVCGLLCVQQKENGKKNPTGFGFVEACDVIESGFFGGRFWLASVLLSTWARTASLCVNTMLHDVMNTSSHFIRHDLSCLYPFQLFFFFYMMVTMITLWQIPGNSWCTFFCFWPKDTENAHLVYVS